MSLQPVRRRARLIVIGLAVLATALSGCANAGRGDIPEVVAFSAGRAMDRLPVPVWTEPEMAWTTSLQDGDALTSSNVGDAFQAAVADGDDVILHLTFGPDFIAPNRQVLYGLDRSDGTIRWRSDEAAPPLDSGLVIVNVALADDVLVLRLIEPTDVTGADERPDRVVGLDAATGEVLWSSDDLRFATVQTHPRHGVLVAHSDGLLRLGSAGTLESVVEGVSHGVGLDAAVVVTETPSPDGGFPEIGLRVVDLETGDVRADFPLTARGQADLDDESQVDGLTIVDDAVVVQVATVLASYGLDGSVRAEGSAPEDLRYSFHPLPGTSHVVASDFGVVSVLDTDLAEVAASSATGSPTVIGDRVIVRQGPDQLDMLSGEPLPMDGYLPGSAQLWRRASATAGDTEAMTLDGEPVWRAVLQPAEGEGEAWPPISIDRGILIGRGAEMTLLQ